jgi:two-component system chemotaxis response regulator CheY
MKRVLVVDDSATVRQQVGHALREAGYEVAEAVDGLDGAEKIDTDRTLAMVICDVTMPRLNGLEMLERVKRDPAHAALPIVMLTTEGQPALIERAKKAGAKAWIIKPFKADLLVAAVKKIAGA